jgi:hypothetical protein
MSENSTCLGSGQGVGPVGRPSTMRIGASGLSGKPNRVSMSLKLAAWGMSDKEGIPDNGKPFPKAPWL